MKRLACLLALALCVGCYHHHHEPARPVIVEPVIIPRQPRPIIIPIPVPVGPHHPR